jgi:hypothetical protein
MCSLLENETFWAAVATLIALASLFTTIHLVRRQISLGERDLYIRMQLQLDEKFNSTRIIKARKKIADSLLNNNPDPWETVMEFFESIGLLLRKKYLDPDMIWATFSYYIIYWWEASREFIEQKQNQDATMYTDFKLLVNKMYEIEMKEQETKNIQDVIPTQSKIKTFLTDEKELPSW